MAFSSTVKASELKNSNNTIPMVPITFQCDQERFQMRGQNLGTYRGSHCQKGRHRIEQQLLLNELGKHDQDQRKHAE